MDVARDVESSMVHELRGVIRNALDFLLKPSNNGEEYHVNLQLSFLNEIYACRCQVLDDFGGGYCCIFIQLQRLPVLFTFYSMQI